MSETQCPNEAELVAFADAALSPERLNRIAAHLKQCSRCEKSVADLKLLMEDVAAPGPRAELDVAEHVASVMKRLDEPVRRPRGPRWALWSGGLAAAAAAVLAIGLMRGPNAQPGDFAARGGAAEASLTRDVGLQLYAQEQSLRALESGAHIRPGAALTAGLHNLGTEPAHLLLFVVDAHGVVHWIAPEFTAEGTNPEAILVTPTPNERLLPSAASFDDLAPGPLRVVAIISRKPTHVADVEALSGEELGAERLLRHFPGAEVRQFALDADTAP